MGSGSAAGVAGAGVFKIGALCLAGAMVAGGAASVCLKSLGVPTPILNAASAHPHTHTHARTRHATVGTQAIVVTPVASITTSAALRAAPASSTATHKHILGNHNWQVASQATSEAQREFKPGGGSGTSINESTSHGPAITTARVATASSLPAESHAQPSPHRSRGEGTIQSGESDEFGP